MSFTDPFGCGPGSPCREILNQISKYDIPEYYPTASDYLSCFTEDQIPCSAITHCISGKTGTDTYVTGTTFVSDQAIVTRNDSTDVLFLSGGTNVTLSNPKTNLIKIDVPDNTITPILIVSNAMSISNPVGSTEYIGDAKAGGWNAISWNLPKPSFTYEHLNCGVPFPHTINSSVSNALNVCGNLFVNGNTIDFNNLPTTGSSVSTGQLFSLSGSQLPFATGSSGTSVRALFNQFSSSKFVLIK